MAKAGRNSPCPCGSGKKYKKCCLPRERSLEAHDESIRLLNEGRLQEAEELLSHSLQENDNVVARNNLATAVLQQGEPRRCLQILAPCLESERPAFVPNPYTWSVASQAMARLGQREEAYQYLECAEDNFAKGLEAVRVDKPDDERSLAWKEYTVAIMRAAAALEDHERVFDIYRRYERYHVNWENYYMAAVACFNLWYYRKAASLWAEVAKEWRAGHLFQQVSVLVEQGVIPPFSLDYSREGMRDFEDLPQKIQDNESWASRALKNTGLRLLMLGMVFNSEPPGPDHEYAAQMLGVMVRHGGDWGEELGRRVLQSHCSIQLKMAAAGALMDRGILSPDQPVPMVIDGQETEVQIQQLPVVEDPDAHTLKAMQEASSLQEEGRLQEAIDLLVKSLYRGGFFPPAALKVCNLLRLQERFDEADSYLRMLEDIAPEHPVVQFSRAGLLFEQGYPALAYKQLKRIDLGQADAEVREKMDLLAERINRKLMNSLYGEAGDMMARHQEQQRKEIEEKRLPTDPTLARCLKNMPAHWLTGICLSLDLEPASRREERTEQILEAMDDASKLRLLMEQSRNKGGPELLRHLLHRGGWVRLNGVTRKFGSMEGDGFYWDEDLPSSTPGRLWALGLAAVGKANLGKRRERIVTIPTELREPLRQILGVPAAGTASGTLVLSPGSTSRPTGSETGGKALVFRASLTDDQGRVRGNPYRVVAVPADYTLYQLASVLVESFDFFFDHAFGFYDNVKRWPRSREGYELFADIGESSRYPGVTNTRVPEAFQAPGKKMLFLFDYGDEWRFIVKLEKEIDMENPEDYPRVLKGQGKLQQY